MPIFLSAVLALVILTAIVLINTARFTSKQMAVQPIEEVNLDEDGAVDRFSRVLQFETVSYADSSKFDPEPFLALHAYLQDASKCMPLSRRRSSGITVSLS